MKCTVCQIEFAPKGSWQRQCSKCFAKAKAAETAELKRTITHLQTQLLARRADVRSLTTQISELRRHLTDLRSQLSRLDATFLRRVIALTHPDKHDGNPEANDVTAILVAMRSEAR